MGGGLKGWLIRAQQPRSETISCKVQHLGLYTILTSLILYDVWHTQEGSVGGRILRNGRAIVMEYGRLCRCGVA